MQTSYFTEKPSHVIECIDRLKALRGVKGVVVATIEGVVLEHYLSDELRTQDDTPTLDLAAQKIANLASPALPSIRLAVASMDPNDEVYFVRVRTRRYEILLYPQGEYVLMALQDPK